MSQQLYLTQGERGECKRKTHLRASLTKVLESEDSSGRETKEKWQDQEKDKGKRTQKEDERGLSSFSTSTEFSCRCSSLIRLHLLDKRLFDNLMHGRTIHPSTIYIKSSLLRARRCHTTHAGIIAQSSLRLLLVLASAHMNGKQRRRSWSGEQQRLETSHPLISLCLSLSLSICTNHLLYFSSGGSLEI